jgi:hypothetical protein
MVPVDPDVVVRNLMKGVHDGGQSYLLAIINMRKSACREYGYTGRYPFIKEPITLMSLGGYTRTEI